jgi:hypothetical protein
MYLWYYRGKFGGCWQILTQKMCRDQNCVPTTAAFGQNVPTFGCLGNMSPTCRQLYWPRFAHHLTLCILCHRSSLCLEEEVASKEDNTDNDATDNNDDDNNNNNDMPPMAKPATAVVAAAAKKKALATKKTTGDKSNKVAVMPPYAPAKRNFLIDATDRFLVAYYSKIVNGYADVAIMVNGIIKKGSYDVQVAKDGLLLLWRWASCSECFKMEILKKILWDKYRDSSHCVVAWDNLRMEMRDKNVCSKQGLFWGAPMVGHLK